MFDLENKSICAYEVRLRMEEYSRKLYTCFNLKICVISGGTGIWEIEEKRYPVKVGDIIILNNRQKRVFREVSKENGIEMMVVEFSPHLFSTYFRRMLFKNDKNVNCKISDNPEIYRLVKEMVHEEKTKQYNYRMILGAKLVEILSLIGRYYNGDSVCERKMSEDMYKVVEYIDENYRGNISLTTTAKLLHISKSSFSRCFLKYMDMSFVQYVMHKRVDYAIYLLQSSEKTVLEIALDCGYNNTASFYKAFKKITNMVPKDYRNMKEEHNV